MQYAEYRKELLNQKSQFEEQSNKLNISIQNFKSQQTVLDEFVESKDEFESKAKMSWEYNSSVSTSFINIKNSSEAYQVQIMEGINSGNYWLILIDDTGKIIEKWENLSKQTSKCTSDINENWSSINDAIKETFEEILNKYSQHIKTTNTDLNKIKSQSIPKLGNK